MSEPYVDFEAFLATLLRKIINNTVELYKYRNKRRMIIKHKWGEGEKSLPDKQPLTFFFSF